MQINEKGGGGLTISSTEITDQEAKEEKKIQAASKSIKTTQRFAYEKKEFVKQWKEVEDKYPLVASALKESTLLLLTSYKKEIRAFSICLAETITLTTGILGQWECNRLVVKELPDLCSCPPGVLCLQYDPLSMEADKCISEWEGCRCSGQQAPWVPEW